MPVATNANFSRRLSVETIKDHVAAVLRTLNVSSRTQAVVAVSRLSHPGAAPSCRQPHHHPGIRS